MLYNVKYLNIGGGNSCHREAGWSNLDYAFEHYKSKRDYTRVDIQHNLMSGEPLPIKDSSVEAVYTEHTMEHITDDKVLIVFKEVKRILRPRGVFRVAIPDSDKMLADLKDPNMTDQAVFDYWLVHGQNNTKEKCLLDLTCSHLLDRITKEELWDIINKSATPEEIYEEMYRIVKTYVDFTPEFQSQYPAYHISWWNYNKMKKYLKLAGFRMVSDPLAYHETEYDFFKAKFIDRTKIDYTTRVEAVKTEKPPKSV